VCIHTDGRCDRGFQRARIRGVHLALLPSLCFLSKVHYGLQVEEHRPGPPLLEPLPFPFRLEHEIETFLKIEVKGICFRLDQEQPDTVSLGRVDGVHSNTLDKNSTDTLILPTLVDRKAPDGHCGYAFDMQCPDLGKALGGLDVFFSKGVHAYGVISDQFPVVEYQHGLPDVLLLVAYYLFGVEEIVQVLDATIEVPYPMRVIFERFVP
jgi:hypothetical protein